jgi:hypothetical protein
MAARRSAWSGGCDPRLRSSTSDTHIGRVLDKLAVRDRVQAVIYAYESGLVEPGGSRRVRDQRSSNPWTTLSLRITGRSWKGPGGRTWRRPP